MVIRKFCFKHYLYFGHMCFVNIVTLDIICPPANFVSLQMRQENAKDDDHVKLSSVNSEVDIFYYVTKNALCAKNKIR